MMTDEKVEECVHTLREENAEATIISTPWDELGKEAISHALTKGAEIESLFEDHEDHDHCDHDHHDHHDHDHDHCDHDHHDHDHDHIAGIGDSLGRGTIITIIMTMITIAAVDTITIITTIIMQMMCLQAGAKRLFINIPKKNWIIC